MAEGLPVHVLIRPRPGGFVHDAGEADVLVAELEQALDAGAVGVVIGALTEAGAVDEPLVARLVAAAGSAEVTFHRAFDVVPDRVAAVQVLAALGVTRVLTSGGQHRAVDALAELERLSRASGVEVMAGGGVRPGDVPALVRAGVAAVHLSARAFTPDPGPAGPGGGPAVPLERTDGDVIRAAVAAARAVAASSSDVRSGPRARSAPPG